MGRLIVKCTWLNLLLSLFLLFLLHPLTLGQTEQQTQASRSTASGGGGQGQPEHSPGPGRSVNRNSKVVKDSSFLCSGSGKCALRFDGRNDFALVREFKHLPSNRITVAAWIKVHRHKAFSRILSHEWIGWGWNLYCDGAGLVRFGIGQDNKDFAAGRIVFKNKWHFVVGRYDGSHLQVFVDGMPGAKTSLINATMDDTGYVSIAGAEYDPFPGELDDIRIYNTALSNEEIIATMVQPPRGDGKESGLVAYWKMDRGVGGNVLYDDSGHGNHAELGKGKRRPLWIQSEAPVSIPCVRQGENLTLELDGVSSSDEEQLQSFIASLPDERVGSLHQARSEHSDGQDATFAAITSAPVEIHDTLLFSASAASAASPLCAMFKYQVHNGEASSAPSIVAVDVVPPDGSCEARGRDWVEKTSACWKARTEMENVRPHGLAPLVSIVIPLYNQAELLKDTMGSILEQTFTDWEVIIVNDGSTDDGKSLAAAKEIIDKYSRGKLGQQPGAKRRIRLVEKINGGLADARNAGIQAASGEWIFPLDSDDLIGADFLERAVDLAKGKRRQGGDGGDSGDGGDGDEKQEECNLVIADLKGFGAWEYAWHVPEYSARDLRYSNMFHCSALFHKSLWQAVPRGYPVETLFGYEDWAFWIFAEELLEGGIKPCYIHEELFYYRIRPDSMHQSLLKNQEYSIASLRMLHPNLFPSELIISAHDKFLGINSEVPLGWRNSAGVPQKVFTTVDDKRKKFPWSGTIHTIKGLLLEGQDNLEAAMEEYLLSCYLSRPEDWQPRWRLGLIQQRLGMYEDGNRTLSQLIEEFDGIDDIYRNFNRLSDQKVERGSIFLRRASTTSTSTTSTSSTEPESMAQLPKDGGKNQKGQDKDEL